MSIPTELGRRESSNYVSPRLSLSSRDTTFLYFTVSTYSEALYSEIIYFYHCLGFDYLRQVENPERATDLGSFEKPAKETWLHLFSKVNNRSVSLRILYMDHAQYIKDSREPAYLPSASSLSYMFKDIKKLQHLLDANNYDYKLHSSKEGVLCLVTKDPVGTQLYIYNDSKLLSAPSSNFVEIVASTKESIPSSRNSLPSSRNSVSDLSALKVVKKIGVLTSGGDAQGMNAAVRAIVRMAIYRNCECFLIYDGYNGLIAGSSKIIKAKREDVSGFLTLGGTAIGTARCMEFREYEGRQKAALNIIKSGINALVVIGGDGSLTGADTLRSEWPSHVKDLLKDGKISESDAQTYTSLMIVGIVGSIDNDLTTTDITIGAHSALTRICEAIDALQSTAFSHHRAFVVEVMGRNCGWLALASAICTGADYVFIPEDPPRGEDWETRMCEALQNSRKAGKRTSMIIVAEGACDSNLNPIKVEYIKEILTQRLQYDTRVTILGHVQRGGSPNFRDRYIGTIQGAEAVEAILRADASTPSLIIGTLENKITAQPLKSAIIFTQQLAKEIKNKNFENAIKLRSPTFKKTLASYKEVATYHIDGRDLFPENKRLNVAILHVGAPAGGANLATRNIVRLCINRGHNPLLVFNGFPGLMRGEIEVASWMQVDMWTVDGGSKLGMNRGQPAENIGAIAYQLQKYSINALVIIGGFEAYTGLISLMGKRKEYPSFCIPMVLIPATISNNVPGTDCSLGSDTAVNFIINCCDNIKLSASSNRKRVFLMEVQGGNSGYLAVMGGITGGATSIYIPEEKINLNSIEKDVSWLKHCYLKESGQSQGRIALYNEYASKSYTLDVLRNIYEGESDDLFGARTSTLGHLQQGGIPSPNDRLNANNFSVAAMEWIQEKCWESMVDPEDTSDKPAYGGLKRSYYPKVYTRDPRTVAVVGILGSEVKFSPLEQLISQTDFKNRKYTNEWWLHLKELIFILSGKYQISEDSVGAYESRAIYLSEEDLKAYFLNDKTIALK
ncbi:hypothetical protein BB560_002599 [Smittium megazygosporum]|uniref:6-phosphofructokinase n=1 Tax=Smittium megazygosporum TaxID=133381 RepID=A0A2T9ZEG4_9FUNG|nr:hypothetical protein BB560_002599 [Smittium megazygosporum]